MVMIVPGSGALILVALDAAAAGAETCTCGVPVGTVKSRLFFIRKRLKEELKDMETSVNDDVNNHELHDQDIFRINEKMKELERQILDVIEG